MILIEPRASAPAGSLAVMSNEHLGIDLASAFFDVDVQYLRRLSPAEREGQLHARKQLFSYLEAIRDDLKARLPSHPINYPEYHGWASMHTLANELVGHVEVAES